MEELLRKYYEYFLKLNTDEMESFNKFYNLIINKYDLESNAVVTKDLQAYHKLYRTLDPLESIRGSAVSTEVKRKRFERKNLSFEYFDPPDNLYTDLRGSFENGFIHTQTHSDKNFCKVYLSVKPEDYVSTTLKLQEYINYLFKYYDEADIGNCKFRKIPANDAVVFRLTSEEQLDALFEFIEENNEIKESFDLPNPFLPCINGVGIITDDGKSYNKFVTSALWNYMIKCMEKKVDVNLEEFINFIQVTDLKMAFTGEDISNSDYKNVLVEKLSNVDDRLIVEGMLNFSEYEDTSTKSVKI